LPSRALPVGIEEELSIDGIADAPLEGAHGFFLGLALGDLALEERAAGRVREADLGDRGDVDGVVQLPVASPGEPVRDPPTRGHLDGGGAGVGGEVVLAGETADVAGVFDEHGGDDRADPENVGQRGG
jgi:hypothetical protein